MAFTALADRYREQSMIRDSKSVPGFDVLEQSQVLIEVLAILLKARYGTDHDSMINSKRETPRRIASRIALARSEPGCGVIYKINKVIIEKAPTLAVELAQALIILLKESQDEMILGCSESVLEDLLVIQEEQSLEIDWALRSSMAGISLPDLWSFVKSSRVETAFKLRGHIVASMRIAAGAWTPRILKEAQKWITDLGLLLDENNVRIIG